MRDLSNLREQFDAEGYVVVEDVLDADALTALETDYANLLDTHVPRWLAEGHIPEAFADLPLHQRSGQLVSFLNDEEFRWFDIAFPQAKKPMGQLPNLSQAVFDLLTHPNLLDCIEALIGGEILVNPIHHVRIKPPEALLKSAKPSGLMKSTGWHQDLGVARSVADDTDMITAWVAITDATEENGCLCVVPRSHDALTTHCTTNGVTIPDALIEQQAVKAIPVRRGGVLLMHRKLQHASLENKSDSIRWSFDLRYQPIGQPTGRDEFPSFVARSRNHLADVMVDHAAWVELWRQTEAWMVTQENFEKSHRWSGDAEVCA
ncbi:MAG: phytanoyl-CoA dioxygenase family protein [Anaerolineae bacterium]|nr:phytanoyl-CoA dioxygenase family protein [Anaerolineae bacterium]